MFFASGLCDASGSMKLLDPVAGYDVSGFAWCVRGLVRDTAAVAVPDSTPSGVPLEPHICRLDLFQLTVHE
jgi:hypothetical protein